MRIYDTLVNHLTNPIGFYMENCTFSWKIAEAKGKRQADARIRIASDEAMQNIIADTGFSALNRLGERIELNLAPCTRYYWVVTVRSDVPGEEAESEVQYFETGKREEDWCGKWISCESGTYKDEVCSRTKRHPFFEKQISLKGKVASARLYICGLGLYEAYYVPDKQGITTNDNLLDHEEYRIGNEHLTPYSNDYNQWVQYQTFDVTKQLQESGILSVLLGNGWYKARFGFTSREDIGFYSDEWKLIAEVQITYEDGSREVIGTDESWTVRRSTIGFSNLYDGELRDDTLPELPLEQAYLCDAPKGRLMERLSLPVTVREHFDAVELLHTPAGEEVFDLGQEFAGIFELKVNEPEGTKIHIQTGEILQQGNFYNANLRSAKSEYIYISDGKEKILRPHFTYYGYRYVKVSGVSNLKKEDLTGLALYSAITQKGTLETGNALVNQLISNVRWGLKSNFIDVPTDCPQRDERMGWTGDAQVFSSTAMYLEDTYAFYRKYLYDMAQEQKALDGKVPDVIPSAGVESSACVWGDASCIIPWNMYLTYGDKSILEDQFESMRSWVDYISRVDGDNHGWRYVFHYGDWLALDNPNGDIEQVLGATDEEFIANLYYAVSAGIVAKAAKVLKKAEEEAYYQNLSDEQFQIVKDEYYSKTGRCCIKTQTALVLTLKYHLSSNEELVKKQLRKLFEDNKDKLKTGFVGTPLLCNVLTDNGFTDLAFKLLLNKEYPGWLHEIELGATTVWERWNSILDDGTISGIGMNSMNHYSYGAVTDWIFRHVAGLNPDENTPGFGFVHFMPELNWKLQNVSGVYDSPAGLYKSSWKLINPQQVEMSFSVPFGCKATLRLPFADESVYQQENPAFSHLENGICYLEPGEYEITYTLNQSLKPVFTIDTPIRELLNDDDMKEKLSSIIGSIENIPEHFYSYSLRNIKEEINAEFVQDDLYEKVKALLDKEQ